MKLDFLNVKGLPEKELGDLRELLNIYNFHEIANDKKERYYAGKISVNEVNIGIALPNDVGKLKVGCSWGAKTVDVLAGRSKFDGFVNANGLEVGLMSTIMRNNKLITEYNKAVKEELKYGCVFAGISGKRGNARIHFYSPRYAAAKWNPEKNRIDCGFAVDSPENDEYNPDYAPKRALFYTDSATWVLKNNYGEWIAEKYTHKFKKPMLIPIIWDATSKKPFGKSRINQPVRGLIEGFVRTIANATIGLEFATSPQKYLMGISDEQYDALIDNKFKQYIGSILLGTTNPDTGEKPTFGQLPQGSIQPHVEMLRVLATQFSAATGLTVTDTGVVNDANPTSSDAILAQSQTLVTLAEQLNESNKDSLYEIAQMALAVELGEDPSTLPEEYKEVVAHFKNPAMPSVAVTADAAIKIASAREGFSSTDVFLEMIGFDQADIRRIKAQEQRARGEKILAEEFTVED